MTAPDTSGLIPINKPRGMTSKDVSRALTRRYGKNLKIGHVGTLDPDADGVLPVLIGRATKLQDYLLDLSKAYSFELFLGAATDTLDATGKILRELPWDHVTRDQVEAIIPRFVGELTQIPPLFSAVKYQGKELYKYARSGQTSEDVPLESLQRKVVITSLVMDYCELPRIGFTVHCGKGTYVRTLADDIATALKTVGHVTRLSRVLSAGIALKDCVTIDQATAESSSLESIITPLDMISIGLPSWETSDMLLVQRLVNGQQVILPMDQFQVVNGERHSVEILVRSTTGKSVGIVDVKSLEGERVKLHLKRGF